LGRSHDRISMPVAIHVSGRGNTQPEAIRRRSPVHGDVGAVVHGGSTAVDVRSPLAAVVCHRTDDCIGVAFLTRRQSLLGGVSYQVVGVLLGRWARPLAPTFSTDVKSLLMPTNALPPGAGVGLLWAALRFGPSGSRPPDRAFGALAASLTRKAASFFFSSPGG
jgi:hypothetical protein